MAHNRHMIVDAARSLKTDGDAACAREDCTV
jgi:hypothetical protein